jgi:hypothetical protein
MTDEGSAGMSITMSTDDYVQPISISKDPGSGCLLSIAAGHEFTETIISNVRAKKSGAQRMRTAFGTSECAQPISSTATDPLA